MPSFEFRPHPLLTNRHAQTVGPKFLYRSRVYPGKLHRVAVSDGDRVAVLENPPSVQGVTRPEAVVLVHGLGSSGHEPNLVRQAKLLQNQGHRVFRMHHRGIDEGALLASHIYHGDRGEDIAAVVAYLVDKLKFKQITLVAYSMSANMVLKLLGRAAQSSWPYLQHISRAICLCPPVDMAASAHAISYSLFGIYNRSITATLRQYLHQRERNFPHVAKLSKYRCRTVLDIDRSFVCYEAGYNTAQDYYAGSSSLTWLPRITTETHVLCSLDDPIAPGSGELTQFSNIVTHLSKRGGHLGFLGRGRRFRTECWADGFVANLIAAGTKGINL